MVLVLVVVVTSIRTGIATKIEDVVPAVAVDGSAWAPEGGVVGPLRLLVKRRQQLRAARLAVASYRPGREAGRRLRRIR